MTDIEKPPYAWHCFESQAEPDWIDRMGHVNVRIYFKLCIDAVEQMVGEHMGAVRRIEPEPMLLSTMSHMFYRRELRVGHKVRVSVRPLRQTGGEMTVLCQVFRTDPDPALSAECIWTGSLADIATREPLPLPEEAAKIFDAKVAEGAAEPYEPPPFRPGFEMPPVPKDFTALSDVGEVPQEWGDKRGEMEVYRYMEIYTRSNGGYLQSINSMFREMLGRNIGIFGLESKTRYLIPLRVGDPYQVRTRTLMLRRKTTTYLHQVYRPGDPPELCATCEHTIAFADLKTRKTMFLPEAYRNALGKVHHMEIPTPEEIGAMEKQGGD